MSLGPIRGETANVTAAKTKMALRRRDLVNRGAVNDVPSASKVDYFRIKRASASRVNLLDRVRAHAPPHGHKHRRSAKTICLPADIGQPFFDGMSEIGRSRFHGADVSYRANRGEDVRNAVCGQCFSRDRQMGEALSGASVQVEQKHSIRMGCRIKQNNRTSFDSFPVASSTPETRALPTLKGRT